MISRRTAFLSNISLDLLLLVSGFPILFTPPTQTPYSWSYKTHDFGTMTGWGTVSGWNSNPVFSVDDEPSSRHDFFLLSSVCLKVLWYSLMFYWKNWYTVSLGSFFFRWADSSSDQPSTCWITIESVPLRGLMCILLRFCVTLDRVFDHFFTTHKRKKEICSMNWWFLLSSH